jgi:hypothetical protein
MILTSSEALVSTLSIKADEEARWRNYFGKISALDPCRRARQVEAVVPPESIKETHRCDPCRLARQVKQFCG